MAKPSVAPGAARDLDEAGEPPRLQVDDDGAVGFVAPVGGDQLARERLNFAEAQGAAPALKESNSTTTPACGGVEPCWWRCSIFTMPTPFA